MNKKRFLVGAATDVGRVRAVNQDNFLARIDNVDTEQVGLFVIADGMGGLADGEYASEIAVSTINEWMNHHIQPLFSNQSHTDESVMAQLEALLKDVNNAIIQYSANRNIQAGIAISLLLIYQSNFFLLHAGDTRVYAINNTAAKQLTEDETWVAEQVRGGRLTPEEAEKHSERHVLVNCLGVFQDVRLRLYTGKAHADEVFLLCSDGLHNMISVKEYPGYVFVKQDMQAVTEELIDLANVRGGFDNITAIMVKMI